MSSGGGDAANPALPKRLDELAMVVPNDGGVRESELDHVGDEAGFVVTD